MLTIAHSRYKKGLTAKMKEHGFAWPISPTSMSSSSEVSKIVNQLKVSHATTSLTTYGNACLNSSKPRVGLVLAHLKTKYTYLVGGILQKMVAIYF